MLATRPLTLQHCQAMIYTEQWNWYYMWNWFQYTSITTAMWRRTEHNYFSRSVSESAGSE